MLRSIAAWLFVGALCFAQAPEAMAGLPLTKQQRLKRQKLIKQARCIQRCQSRAYRKFYRCGSPRSVECNIRGWLQYRSCLTRCKAPWFCKSFRNNKIYLRCGKLCLNEARGKRRRFCRRRRHTRRSRKICLRRYMSWRKRSRHSCKRICKTLFYFCSIQVKVKLPPPLKLPSWNKM